MAAGSRKERVVSRDEIHGLIANGHKIVICHDAVLKVDAWLPFHPGGDKAILHMVGRDATNEIVAFHSTETQAFMSRYQIGKIRGLWQDFVPPIQGGVFTTEKTSLHENTHSIKDDSSVEGSEQGSPEPSPIFDAVRHHSSHLKRRKASDDLVSEYSATSLSSMELDVPEEHVKAAWSGDDRTAQELARDLQEYPSLDAKTQQEIVDKYRQLDATIRSAGLYDCNYAAYGIEAVRYVALGLASFYLLRAGWFVLSGVFLGMLWHQLVFTVHDAGHMGITHGFHTDTMIGMLIANYVGGLSVCWWKRNHNVHHIVTNSAEHDPDIQHMPFFAVSHRFFESLRSTYYDRILAYDAVAKFMLKYQHYMYYPILTFGRFNLYFLSWQYILLGQGPRKGPAWWHRWFELAGQVFFWYWFGYLVVYKSIPSAGSRIAFVLASHMTTMMVHVQITLSHFAMSTSDLGVAESFPQRMLRTTMDVDCPTWLDFFHGGLQFQAIHHLFPRIPRHNLRACQKLVMEFCRDVGIPYAIYGFAEGNGKVIGHLGDVANQARIMAECQRSIAVSDVLGGH